LIPSPEREVKSKDLTPHSAGCENRRETGGFLLFKLWRGQGCPKPNFLKTTLIGKTYCLPPINLTLAMFRVAGFGGEQFLSTVTPPR